MGCYRRNIGEQLSGPRVSLTPIVIAIILTFTAIPSELRYPSWSVIEIVGDRGDLIRNVIFFLPLGWLSHRGLLATFILGAVVSTCAEALQTFSATRHPALSDIVTNIIGTVAGWLLARAVLGPSKNVPRTIPFPRVLCVLSLVGGLILSLTMIPQSVRSDISNWDSTFLLKVGSEPGGQPDWRGEVSGVRITSGAMSADAIAKLAAQGPGDLPRTLPPSDLELFRKITDAGQFTVLVWGSTDDLQQKGPVRIVTWSRDMFASNMTIAQDGPRIVFRVRTVSTNLIGGHPETQTPPVLEAGRAFFIAGTYDGVFARVFINGVPMAENDLSVKLPLPYLPGLAGALLSGFLLALGSRLFLSPSFTLSRLSIGIILVGLVALSVSGWGYLPAAQTLRFAALFTAGVLVAGASVREEKLKTQEQA